MKSIAFIDCFVETPVNKCVNSFVLESGLPCTYHMASKYGVSTLKQLEKADAYIILGSASHVTENLSWHKELLSFIIPKIEAKIPTLGICFGHQLIAHHYGLDVGYLYEDKKKLTEVRDIIFLKDELEIRKGQQLSLAYAHSQVVKSINDKFEHIARSETCLYEGLKLKGNPYWSFQAHPEASKSFIKEDAAVTDEKLITKTLSDSYKLLMGFVQNL